MAASQKDKGNKKKSKVKVKLLSLRTKAIIAASIAGVVAFAFFVMVVVSMVVSIVTGIVAVLESEESSINNSSVIGHRAYNLTDNTLRWIPTLEREAEQQGMQQWTEVLKAIMDIESGGIDDRWTDRMCCSESPFNTKYSHAVGAIRDPVYSIAVGVQTLKYFVDKFGFSAFDANSVQIAAQCYNMGEGFYSYLVRNYDGKYSKAAASAYSRYMQSQMGWQTYGNPSYVERFLERFEFVASTSGTSNPDGLVLPVPEGYSITTAYSGWHTAIDYAMAINTPIYAAADGTVTFTYTWNGVVTQGDNNSYGNFVQILHDNGASTLYAHMTNYIVKEGQTVRQGEIIGYMGSTGNSTGPHLHFELIINGTKVNPIPYILGSAHL